MNRRRVCAAALFVLVSWASISPPQALAQLLGSLIVTISSPTSGSTVRGTVTVSASVSIIGSLTVSQVQFFDGTTSLGVDTTNSYSVSWNTTATTNGSHTLTAVARDNFGVSWTSDPVTVTVSNPPTITSFTPPSGPVGSGVTISGTNFTGASAVTFNGTSAGFTVNSATTITATVPSGATSGTISVTTSGGTATSASNFTVTVTLTVTKTGIIGGTVTSTSSPDSPTQINCGATCLVSYNIGTAVTLTATPAFGSVFLSWSGACSGILVNSCTITMSEAKSVTANFLP